MVENLPENLQREVEEQLEILTDATSETATVQMINLFLRNTPLKLNSLMSALETKDCGQISNIAHQLKSSCGYLGLRALEQDFTNLETEAKQSRITEMPQLKNHISSHVNQYTNFLTKYLTHYDQRSSR